ncbi:MAG: 2-dehydropantoate 2-reductase N-terminal domain-containing protein [Bdellovibrionota bacterium]
MEKNTYKPCLIVGLGAVGVTIAARLQIMGIPTVFWGRSGKLNDSFDFKGWNKNLRVEPTCGKHKPFESSDVALAFICVKAYDLEKCLQDVCARLVPGTVVIPVSNGAVDDVLMRKSEEFTNLHWRQGLCAFGTSSIIRGSSSHTSLTNLGYQLTSSQSQCMWGPLNGIDKIEDIEVQLLDLDQNIFFQYKNDVTLFIRRKWLYNTVMNTLCAVHAH